MIDIVTEAMIAEQSKQLHDSLDSVGASIDRMRKRLDLMQSELLAAAEQFSQYANYHWAKTPPHREKAEANFTWAIRCRAAAGVADG